MGQITALLKEALARGDSARYILRATDPDAAWTWQGECCRLLAEAIPQVEALEGAPAPPPEPPPPLTESWAHLLSDAPGLAGYQKWKPGSTGCDLFVKRGTRVKAPIAGVMTFQQVPGGPMPIGEMRIVAQDGSTVRFRHVSALLATGTTVAVGQDVAQVNDPSMDLLRWPAGYPTPPDSYQHLDISLASSPARLDPTGGAGGDIDADQYIRSKGGVNNIQWIARTPGPPEGSMSAEVRAAWSAWAQS